MLKAVVALLALAFVASRVLPRRRLPWAVPVALVVAILVVRGVGYLTDDG